MNPLKGKTVVITRPREQAAEFISLLQSEGAEPILFPAIEIVPTESWEKCDETIEHLERYDAIIFSSTNAVGYFFQRITEPHIQMLKKKSVYVVGEKTGIEVAKHGVTPIAPPDVFDGKHLAEKIVGDGVRGKHFLHPTGNLTRTTIQNELTGNGAKVDEVIVYQTLASSNADSEKMVKMFEQKKIDAVTFFSPSSIENFVSAISQKLLSNVAVAVIGKASAETAEKNGLHVDVVAHPSTSDGMVESLKKYFTKTGKNVEHTT